MAKRIAIVGAGPAGLMAADYLSQYDYEIHVFEQKPSAARKFLMAGKTGLNISHAEPIAQFIQRYDQVDWLQPWIKQYDAAWIQAWMQDLGIASYIGSSGRIFPVEMKAAPLLRAWLKRLLNAQVKFYYRHQVMDLTQQQLTVCNLTTQDCQQLPFDAIILACGAVSWPQLGSDGHWQAWLNPKEINPFQASNVGVQRRWSSFMQPIWGQPLKRVAVWVEDSIATVGDVVITHYGLESGLIYKYGRALRQQYQQQQKMQLYLDLLPDQSVQQLQQKLQPHKKHSLSNVWRKAGLDVAKASLVRELVPKPLWHQPLQLATQIKNLCVDIESFRPIEEAISCAGGVRRDSLTTQLQLKTHPAVFLCGEMLDWDAPTGGYLLTACFATGRAAAQGVHQFLT
ncbi:MULTISPECIES: TIGR03862 family flavoprotein [unclassified Acinetobacter]|uniref:TIGR03862 family flavoprotein n=1 Tax=unclassified Acinetobacter TaxID=196816 RepID=UPI002934BCEB|nr:MULTISPECIES: TIGR03862 family flavoprotein [unclassified Acinetobacter]WOE30578.1 TIGR03862 family flavoprotein [Acinetobacter sp. SAAs470]WOE38770.1 TIGR03862 family flavoprotein [Acinetobacter sp. SAAs474]